VSARTPLDSLGALEIVRRIHEQDGFVPAAVTRELPRIARAVEAAARALRRGGRIFYVGAGTSGRLGALDAAECPPTFGIEPEKIQAIIAGGPRALLHAAEAAEDNAEQGARDLAARKVGPRDLVIGLSASGRTPYTVGAVRYARSRRATTVAIACNPGSPLERAAHVGIIPLTGAEIISGSTRMKAGLAQKMILQMISTATMTRLGYVYGNHMVGVRPTNGKLVARACGIISSITGASAEAARTALAQADNDVRRAIVMLAKALSAKAAAQALKRHAGNLRKVL
jgi:N-acetylmuramic acid 6-phosphate etherase